MEELRGFRRDPVGHQELQDAKEHVKGSLVLGLESSSSRMSNLARQEIYFGRQSSMDELVADIDAVTVGQVHDLAGELFGDGSASMAAVGRVSDSRLSEEQVRF